MTAFLATILLAMNFNIYQKIYEHSKYQHLILKEYEAHGIEGVKNFHKTYWELFLV